MIWENVSKIRENSTAPKILCGSPQFFKFSDTGHEAIRSPSPAID